MLEATTFIGCRLLSAHAFSFVCVLSSIAISLPVVLIVLFNSYRKTANVDAVGGIRGAAD
jgi:hypothetical protein